MGRNIWLVAALLVVLLVAGDLTLGALRSEAPTEPTDHTPSPTPITTPSPTATTRATPQPSPSIYEQEPDVEPTATEATEAPEIIDPCAAVVAEELGLAPDELNIYFEPIDIYRPPGRVLIAMGRADENTEGCWAGSSGSTVHVVPVRGIDAGAFLDEINEGSIAACYVHDGTDARGWTKLSVPDEDLPKAGVGVRAQYVLIGPDMVALVRLH